MSVMIDQSMQKQAATNGGEWAGPCPKCGGEDRFRVWPDHPEYDTGRFWCRQCDWSGDGIDYLQELRGLTFPEACEALGVTHKLNTSQKPNRKRKSRPQQKPPRKRRPTAKVATLPGPVWQERAVNVALRAHELLYSDAGSEAYAYLKGRGLSDVVICEAGLGYIPAYAQDDPSAWGLSDRTDPVHLPQGITIPWLASGTEPRLWRLKVRKMQHEAGSLVPVTGSRTYGQVPGCAEGLFCEAEVRPGEPVVLCEGEMDALSVWEFARGRFRAVATGSANAGRLVQWRGLLAMASHVLVAFDADDAGEEQSEYWLTLPNARRLRPTRHDVNEMLVAGDDVGGWIEQALESATDQTSTVQAVQG